MAEGSSAAASAAEPEGSLWDLSYAFRRPAGTAGGLGSDDVEEEAEVKVWIVQDLFGHAEEEEEEENEEETAEVARAEASVARGEVSPVGIPPVSGRGEGQGIEGEGQEEEQETVQAAGAGEEREEGSLSHIQWIGSVQIARYLEKEGWPAAADGAAGGWEGKRVLELGAGLGMLGIYLAKACPDLQDMVITDMHTQRAKRNAVRNFLSEEEADEAEATSGLNATVALLPPPVRIRRLQWGEHPPETVRARFGAPYDLLLAGDCVYAAEAVEPLLHTMYALSDENTIILLCGIVGDRAWRAFHRRMPDFFEVVRILAGSERALALRRSESVSGEGAAEKIMVPAARALVQLRKRSLTP